MAASLLHFADRVRVVLARSYGRQQFLRRAKGWLYATLASRLPGLGRPHVMRTSLRLGRAEVELWVDAHSSVGLWATMFGCYEPESIARLVDLTKKLGVESPTFIDVGANIGFYSIGLALAFPGARVIACEPGPAASALCERNLAEIAPRLREICSSIELVRAAVTDHEGEVALTVSHDVGHSSLVEVETFEKETITVPAVTLASLCASFHRDSADVCKIDVEGAELDVVQGMIPLLQRRAISLLQVEVNRPLWAKSGRTAADLVALFARHDYALLPEQHALLQRDDWNVEDFIFVSPTARARILA